MLKQRQRHSDWDRLQMKFFLIKNYAVGARKQKGGEQFLFFSSLDRFVVCIRMSVDFLPLFCLQCTKLPSLNHRFPWTSRQSRVPNKTFLFLKTDTWRWLRNTWRFEYRVITVKTNCGWDIIRNIDSTFCALSEFFCIFLRNPLKCSRK